MMNIIGVSGDATPDEILERRSVTFDIQDELPNNKISQVKIELPKSEQMSIKEH